MADTPFLYRYDASGLLLDQSLIEGFEFGEKRHIAINEAGFIFLAGNRGNYDTGAVDAVIFKGAYYPPPGAPYLYPISPDLAGNRSFRLQWTPVAGATNYSVYYSRRGSLGGMDIQIASSAFVVNTTVGTSSDVVWGANDVGIMYFAVVAANASGISVASNCQAATFAPRPVGPLEVLGIVLAICIPVVAVLGGTRWMLVRRRRGRAPD